LTGVAADRFSLSDLDGLSGELGNIESRTAVAVLDGVVKKHRIM